MRCARKLAPSQAAQKAAAEYKDKLAKAVKKGKAIELERTKAVAQVAELSAALATAQETAELAKERLTGLEQDKEDLERRMLDSAAADEARSGELAQKTSALEAQSERVRRRACLGWESRLLGVVFRPRIAENP